MERECTVNKLSDLQRTTLEDVLGQKLSANQRLIIKVIDANADKESAHAVGGLPLPEWFNVLDGLSDEEIADFDRVVSQRADLTRSFE